MSLSKKNKQNEFLKVLVDCDFNITKACEQIEITRKTYYDWLKEDEEFKEALDCVKEGMKDLAEETLIEIMRDKLNPQRASVAKWFLERKAKERGYSKPIEEPKIVNNNQEVKQIIFITSIPRPEIQSGEEVKRIEYEEKDIIDMEENPKRIEEYVPRKDS